MRGGELGELGAIVNLSRGITATAGTPRLGLSPARRPSRAQCTIWVRGGRSWVRSYSELPEICLRFHVSPVPSSPPAPVLIERAPTHQAAGCHSLLRRSMRFMPAPSEMSTAQCLPEKIEHMAEETWQTRPPTY
jgi:hypothetical protein